MSVDTSAVTARLPAAVGSVAAGSANGAYEGAGSLLATTGLEATDVVHVVEYVTAAALAAYDRVERARTALLGDHVVPVATVPVEGFPGTGALADPDGAALAVELTAHPGGGRLVIARPGQGFDRGALRIAGGIVHLPNVHPVHPVHLPETAETAETAAGSGDSGIRPAHAGDFRAQYRRCLETVTELLKAAGLGPEALVQTTDYTARATRADYPRCGRPRRELLGGTGVDGLAVFPGAAGILVDRPVVPGAMVSLDAVASTAPLRAVNPGWRRYETLTYRPGVAAGGTLFMSGFAALEPATQRALFAGDLLAQAEFTYASIGQVLREAGTAGDSVGRLVEYLTPQAAQAEIDGLDELRRRYFGAEVAVTSVFCSALLRPEFLIEVVPTAVLG